ncbi:MAG TPA: hypothetical protein VMI75_09760, partial [Polyangiaceae bacterium]|nr:hypothetical protein [Polyangiaceae bacterium]
RMLIDATLWSPAEPTAANITTDRKGHTMRFTTLLLVGLVMLGGASCASAPSAQPGADVSGTWQGTWAYSQQSTLGSGQITMTLSQTGSKATGSMVVTGAPVDRSGPVTILVSGNDVHFVYPTGFTGYLTVSGDDMKGQIDGMNPANVVLKRQR